MVFRALVAMVLLAPLPFGAVPAWARAIMAGGAGALLLGWGSLAATGRTPVVRSAAGREGGASRHRDA